MGNILLRKEAATDCEGYPTLIFQAHMDMVCQKTEEAKIDPAREPLKIKIVDGYVTAEGTTLGADNGIGVAYALAAFLLDNHGPLEAILTVDEETGMTGALEMEKGFFSGKYLLNLDSEELGTITIGSAGGGDTEYHLPLTIKKRENWKAIKIEVKNLKGGHSGIHIDSPHLNAIKTVVNGILSLKDNAEFLISSINGGSVHNAIPVNAECILLVPAERKKEALAVLEKWREKVLEDNRENEPEMEIVVSQTDESKGLTEEQTDALLSLLNEIPHGPLSYSNEMEGLVQTSNNLATVETCEETVDIALSSRSSVNKELKQLQEHLADLGEPYGANVEQPQIYPGWEPDPNSPFLLMVKGSYETILKKEVSLKAMHAGLECGMFLQLNQELQVVSIGPDIKDVHTPDERIFIKSVGIVWKVLRDVIENMGTM